MDITNWHQYSLNYSGITDSGMKRTRNEDQFLLFPEAPLFCVADGAGGHSAGEKASQITVASIESFFQRAILAIDINSTPPIGMVFDRDSKKPFLVQAIEYANKKVHANITSDSMASTIVACHFHDHSAFIAHVGDSRAYLIRDNSIIRLTDDHSLVYELFKMGKITEDELLTHPRRNIITRAIGPIEEVSVSCNILKPEPDDLLLLCSDGLTSMLDEDSILENCGREGDLDSRVSALIQGANQAGGSDNITAILIELKAT